MDAVQIGPGVRIRSIEIVSFDIPPAPPAVTASRRRSWWVDAEVANPMSRFPKVKRHRSLWRRRWPEAWCMVTAEDGAFGMGVLYHAQPAAPVVEHLASQLVGEDCTDIARLWDMMCRMTKPYGTQGLASFAVSALDLALWDLRGKREGLPVHALLGAGRRRIPCYATGNDVDWYRELGFRAFKLACPYGPADGQEGLRRNEEHVARARETVGDECDLMLDCWMAFDVDYAVRLAETLRPYHLRWIEECLAPEDMDAHVELRDRLPSQPLATGEHWYTPLPFAWAARRRVVDILQPDIAWCGGLSCCLEVANVAAAAQMELTLHAGGNTAYGQHFSLACETVPVLEYFIATDPGVPLEHTARPPGVPVPRDGWIEPSDAPGFGLEIPVERIRRWSAA